MESRRCWFRKVVARREFGIVVSLGILVIIFSSVNPVFLNIDNIFTMLRASAFMGVMAVGVAWLLMSGSIDLSIGGVAGLASVITAQMIVAGGYPVIPSILAGLSAGVVFGILNYNLVFGLKIPAFLATIGTMYIAKGLGEFISNGFQIYISEPESVRAFGTATPLGISWHFIIFITLMIVSQIILFETVYGLEVRATGSNRETAKNTEVNIRKISISTFLIVSILSALAGILLMSRIITGTTAVGTGWELATITACAIGGVSLFGYEGSFVGVFLGVLTLQVIKNGLVVVGLSPYLNTAIVGIILVVTAAIDWQRRSQLDL
ncbi:MAG: ABC transporter permease [Candidatus Thorarchaeota archaeon]